MSLIPYSYHILSPFTAQTAIGLWRFPYALCKKKNIKIIR